MYYAEYTERASGDINCGQKINMKRTHPAAWNLGRFRWHVRLFLPPDGLLEERECGLCVRELHRRPWDAGWTGSRKEICILSIDRYRCSGQLSTWYGVPTPPKVSPRVFIGALGRILTGHNV